MNVSGVYSRHDHPDDDGSWVLKDAILIYQDDAQRLTYNFELVRESNYSRRGVFEEGFVYLEAEGREVHFEQIQRYVWGAGGGMGYDISHYHRYTYQPRQVMQVFHVFEEAEIVSGPLAKRIIYGETKKVLWEEKKDLLYERAEDGEHIWSESAEGLEISILQTRDEYRNHWQDTVGRFVQVKLSQGMHPDEIADRCDWTVESIRDSWKTVRSAKKKKEQ